MNSKCRDEIRRLIQHGDDRVELLDAHIPTITGNGWIISRRTATLDPNRSGSPSRRHLLDTYILAVSFHENFGKAIERLADLATSGMEDMRED
jgi:lipopolysaccharide biosynthesis regulator YciM